MDEEVPPAFELDNQILAATAEPTDSLALELVCDQLGRLGPGESGIGDLDLLERPAHEARLEAAPDRLHLR
jgi:hypothetical protein